MDPRINVKANSIQMALKADGLAAPDGTLRTLTLVSPDGRVTLTLPPEAFPFLHPDICFVTLSVFQVQQAAIQPATESLILNAQPR